MRTTLDIPAELLNEAKDILGFKSKTDTIIMALKEMIRLHRLREIQNSFGKIDIDIDLDKTRKRHKRELVEFDV